MVLVITESSDKFDLQRNGLLLERSEEKFDSPDELGSEKEIRYSTDNNNCLFLRVLLAHPVEK
jgi:hypothetical protein